MNLGYHELRFEKLEFLMKNNCTSGKMEIVLPHKKWIVVVGCESTLLLQSLSFEVVRVAAAAASCVCSMSEGTRLGLPCFERTFPFWTLQFGTC